PRLTRNGSEVDPSLVSKRARIRIFGQRELQSYAQDPELRRDFVAWHAGADWSNLVDAERLILSKLGGVDGLIDSLERQLEHLDSLKEQLADLNERLDRARERGIESLFAQSESLEQANIEMMSVLAWPEQVRSAVVPLHRALPSPSVPTG